MTCKMTDEQWDCVRTDAASLGHDYAEWIDGMGGSLGAAREGILAALLERYDARAAEIMRARAMDTLQAIDGELP